MNDKIRASFLLGACGDALGAPVEILKRKDIVTRYGSGGLCDMVGFTNTHDSPEGVFSPAGMITDDTTMAMTTALALALALRLHPLDTSEFADALMRFLWQGYLQWGACQVGGESLSRHTDPSIAWPPLAREFWFACGAGRGTIAALRQGRPGCFSRPLQYKETVRGKDVKGPNVGCGGMMRVTPLAFLPGADADTVFILARDSTALTHGRHAAVAAGFVGLLVFFAAQDASPAAAVHRARSHLAVYADRPGHRTAVEKIFSAVDMAIEAAHASPADAEVLDGLPRHMGSADVFSALPVLAQVVYVLVCADAATTPDEIRAALRLAVNHGGDSDSVGAIVGNVLGAARGVDVLPTDWVQRLIHRHAILAAADLLASAGKHQPVLRHLP